MQGSPAPGAPTAEAPLIIGRYAIYDAIAAGGMATVHLGRLLGPAGFLRTVAIKRLRAQYAHDADFAAMFLDEARLAARIQHPNVVPTVDVVVHEGELLLVMEYVRGESLSRLVRAARDQGVKLPPRVVVAILSGALQGLHAAHEAVDEKGRSLGLVHRDVSPQNILVGADGVARVLDFGIAKAEGRAHSTREGDIKGKVLYMPPEQLAAEPLTRTADIYSAGIVLFETLTNIRMFAGESERAALTKIINNEIRVPGEVDPELAKFDPIVRRAMAGDATARYRSALQMARELEAIAAPASAAEVTEWLAKLAGDTLSERARIVAEVEASSTRSKPPVAPPTDSVPRVRIPSEASHPSLPRMTAPAAPLEAAPPPRGRTLALVGVAVLVTALLGCLAVIAVLLTREPSSSKTASAAEPAKLTPTVAAPEEPVAITIAPKANLQPAPPVAAPQASTTTATPSVKPKPAAPWRPSCNPPYVIDKNGHKHFIPECVH